MANINNFQREPSIIFDTDWKTVGWKGKFSEVEKNEKEVESLVTRMNDLNNSLSLFPVITFKEIHPLLENIKRCFPDKKLQPIFAEQIIELIYFYHLSKVNLDDDIEAEIKKIFDCGPQFLSEIFTDKQTFDDCVSILKGENPAGYWAIDETGKYIGGEEGKRFISAWFQVIQEKGKIPKKSKSLTRKKLLSLLKNQFPELDISVRTLFDKGNYGSKVKTNKIIISKLV